jgi:hypothetical protein
MTPEAGGFAEGGGARFGIADRVYRRPTGETWLLAYADFETGDLSWLGWPEGRARISDCDLVEPATETTRLYWATQLERSSLPRAGVARRLYPELFAEVRAALDEEAGEHADANKKESQTP